MRSLNKEVRKKDKEQKERTVLPSCLSDWPSCLFHFLLTGTSCGLPSIIRKKTHHNYAICQSLL